MTLVKCCSGKQVSDQECLESLQRLRTPDHLPMDHNAAQARHQAQQQRNRRHTTVHDVRRASIDSENLRQYSKRRFEFAIKNLSNSDTAVNIFRINDVPRPNTTPHLPTQTCSSSLRTGPTQYGSVLYNRKPMMLSSIRVRPQSEAGKYSHTRGRTNPGIERTLHQSNSDYSVRWTSDPRGQPSWPHSKTTRQPSLDLFLIPNGGDREFFPDYVDDRLQENTLDGSTCTRISSRPEMCFITSLAARRDGYMADNISETSSGSRHRQQRSTTTSPLPSQCRWATPNVGNLARPGDSKHWGNIGRLGRPLTGRLGRPLTGKWRTGSDCSSSGSLSSDDSSMSERPKCWVDDVTISSDASQHSQEDMEPVAATDNKSTTQKLPANPKEATKTGPQKGRTSQTEGSKIYRQKSSPNLIEELQNTKKETSNLVDGSKLKRSGSGFINVNEQVGSETVNQGPGELDGDVEDAEKDVSDVKDVPENVFPTFLCPSSEKKSRQTALKYWLANTCFSCADRRVPLV